ncbi:MAG: hypothetical protein J5725_08875 [Bacteroidales bacterium]|nr:hypothetical protein [Bacteroidales bacterium]
MKRYINTDDKITPSGYIGIWWNYGDNNIHSRKCIIDDGYNVDGYIMQDTLIPSIGERSGVVIYNIRANSYDILCSSEIASNSTVLKAIADEFNISDLRHEVIPSSCCVNVHTCTGKPILDNFD